MIPVALARDDVAVGKDTPVSFNRQVRPILSDKCFTCHGPDAGTREADLRLDVADEALADRDGSPVIIPGNSQDSELIHRILSDDEDLRMPPVGSNLSLSDSERDTLVRWIEQGASYEQHWSLIPPQKSDIPAFDGQPLHPIDGFVEQRLRREGWSLQPEATREELIRRVTLDLTGLPPTSEDVDRFLADHSSDAYEKLVDRILESPHYGERMAVDWLDAARYADTHGYLFDTARVMYRWRDWVIDAFNCNQPFDEFTIEQLAGDLLPEATFEQKLATGFNRNHAINNEAGATPAEYFVENIVDRVNTVSTVWMGLTMGCAQCHDHKYDPISQKEYYELYAFFNQVPEVGLDGFNDNANPKMPAPASEQLQRIESIASEIEQGWKEFGATEDEMQQTMRTWGASFLQPPEPVEQDLTACLPLDDSTSETVSTATAAVRDGTPLFEDGVISKAAAFDGQRYLDLGNEADFDIDSPFTLAAWVYQTDQKFRRPILSRMEVPKELFRGYGLQMIDGRPTLFLVGSFPANVIQVDTQARFELREWHHVAATYDGSGKSAGISIYVDGEQQEVRRTLDTLEGMSFRADRPLLVGYGEPNVKFIGRLDEVRVFSRALSDDEVRRLPGVSIHSMLAVEEAQRGDELSNRIREYFMEHHAPPEWKSGFAGIQALRKERADLERSIPTTMIMDELDEPRETRMLQRGAWDSPGDVVTAAIPSALPALPENAPLNRLGLARWLVSRSHPLTARVIVNRFWQIYFPHGLVGTVDDFGQQGEWPSHPELLDWLSVEFMDSGWNVKRLQKLIVTSRTYRQSAVASADIIAADPDNRLLSRGPRSRLKAEFIRDQALAASGLLTRRLGGPSVKPYQPEGLWKEVAFDPSGMTLTAQVYEPSSGDDLYRRSLYTFWKRTLPPPTLAVFDAPDRERCVVRRENTNTPLQALIVLNDPTYVEAARKLAELMLTAGGDTPAERLAYGFRRLTARRPAENETTALLELVEQQRVRFMNDENAATELLSIGESKYDESLPAAELAAYTIAASVFLNLDEVLTR